MVPDFAHAVVADEDQHAPSAVHPIALLQRGKDSTNHVVHLLLLWLHERAGTVSEGNTSTLQTDLLGPARWPMWSSPR